MDLRRIRELTEALSGSAVGRFQSLAVPEEGALYARGTLTRLLGSTYITLPSGLVVPQSAAASTQPIDLLHVFLTGIEVFGREIPAGTITSYFEEANSWANLLACAQLMSALERPNARLADVSLELTDYLDEAHAIRARNLVKSGRILISPQGVMTAARLALKLGAVDNFDGQVRNVIPVILAIQDRLGAESRFVSGEVPPGLDPSSDRGIIAEIVANQDFNRAMDQAFQIASWQRRWRDIPHQMCDHSEYADLEEAYAEATGASLTDVFLIGLGLWSAAINPEYGPFVPRNWFSSLHWTEERFDAAMGVMSLSLTELRSRMLESDRDPTADWSFDQLRRYPVIALNEGYIVLSPRLILERVTSWLLRWDLTRFGPTEGRQASGAVNFLRQVCERQVHESLSEIVPSGQGQQRMWHGDELRLAFGKKKGLRLADGAIEYGDAWAVIEISTRTIRRAVVVEGALDVLADDLRIGVVEKASQLDATIRELMNDESRLTDHPARPRRRYLPVLVTTEGFPVNPMTMASVRQLLKDRGLLQDPRIGPLSILDLEDLYLLESACIHTGISLLTYLERHLGSTLRDMSFQTWLVEDARETPPRSRRLIAAMDRAVRNAAQHLEPDIATGDSDAATGPK